MSEAFDFDMRGFIPNSLLEWEGRLACVVVAGGCNLRCSYCHSWRYVTGVSELERLDIEDVFSLLKRQRGWIGGVVFTGGEPTLQPGLSEVMGRVRRDFRAPVKLHTNGSRPEVVKELCAEGLVDCLALDFKGPLDDSFFGVAGIDVDYGVLERVRETFSFAAGCGDLEREYHTTLCPAFVDLAVFRRMAEWLDSGGSWFLQQYESRDCLCPAVAGAARYGVEELEAFAAVARERHGRVLLKQGT